VSFLHVDKGKVTIILEFFDIKAQRGH